MDNSDFFLGFAAHAHTKSELGIDQVKEELRRANSAEEAQRLAEMVLDRLATDVSKSGCRLDDVKLLVLYVSYRGEPEEKDTVMCESILRCIKERFEKGSAAN